LRNSRLGRRHNAAVSSRTSPHRQMQWTVDISCGVGISHSTARLSADASELGWHVVADFDVERSYARLQAGEPPSPTEGPFVREDGTLSACPGSMRLVNVQLVWELYGILKVTNCSSYTLPADCRAREPVCGWLNETLCVYQPLTKKRLICTRSALVPGLPFGSTRPNTLTTAALFGTGYR
jgi:hypothetical protein